MQIKQIDVLVHPDFYQMPLPDWPFHDSQLAIRDKWEQRFELLKKTDNAILIYYSYLTSDKIRRGTEDLFIIKNKIEREEIERIIKVKSMLGNRLILFGSFEMPEVKSINKLFAHNGFTYIPEETKILAYGEILEMCVWANASNTANILDIPFPNIKYSREESLSKKSMNEIFNWRIGGMYS